MAEHRCARVDVARVTMVVGLGGSGKYGTPAEVWRVWQSTEELIDHAHACCLFRELTPEERGQFGLPER
ncbi:MAG: hypothetical protein ISS56_14485 [Anaerolineae bacterium]|nr:hypothetical protein [Anaerolineae bacterium]